MTENNIKYVDHLKEDTIIPNQRFCCISFLSPEEIRNCTLRGLKVRGVFPTYDEAKAFATELQKNDPDFDVFVGEVGKWLPWDPDPNSVEDQQYQEKELNDLMVAYKENREKAKKMQEERKTDMIKKAAVSQKMNKNEDIRDRLRKKLEAKKKAENGESTESVEKTQKQKEIEEELKRIEEQEKLAKAERERIAKKEQTVSEPTSVNDKLKKVQEMYKKVQSNQ